MDIFIENIIETIVKYPNSSLLDIFAQVISNIQESPISSEATSDPFTLLTQLLNKFQSFTYDSKESLLMEYPEGELTSESLNLKKLWIAPMSKLLIL